MSILSIKLDQAGMSGVSPKVIYIETNDSIATVTAAGYLNAAVAKQNFQFSESDMALVSTKETPSSSIGVGWYEISQSAGDWSLAAPASPGEVILPTTLNHIATYTNATGTLSEDAATAINAGNIQAGSSGVAGFLSSFPSVAASGSFIMSAFPNSADVTVRIQNEAHAQDTIYKITDIGEASGSILVNVLDSADPNSNNIDFDVTVTAAALASGGSVILQASSGSKQYRLREMFLNRGGINFSGGGGDRDSIVTDGVSTFSSLAAATMQTLPNVRWGEPAFPFSGSLAVNQSTDPGADLVVQYSGGTTDYTTGSMVISGTISRIV